MRTKVDAPSGVDQKGEAMIFPKGEVRHRNLLTAYTDFPALLSTLKSEDFSGIIEIDFPENKGVIFVDSGEIINAEAKRENHSNRMIGPEAVRYLLTLANQKDGILNIYPLSPERVAIVASHLQHEIIFKGLSTEFTRLDRLLLKLKEEKHNGFIEILTRENQAMGVLFLEEGEPMEMFTTPESGPSIFGRKSIPLLVENATKEGALFNVYRDQVKIVKKETVVPPSPGPAENLKELILIFQDILSKTEKTVDQVSRKGKFAEVFKTSLIQISDEYPFLDPFGGEFNYQDGTILFLSEVGEQDFAKGIAECFRVTLSHLGKEIPSDKISPEKLRAEIESSLERHKETIKRLGIDGIVSSMLP